jgi:hypothetical protein
MKPAAQSEMKRIGRVILVEQVVRRILAQAHRGSQG